MLRIKKLRIEKFRGILDLTLDLNKKNYGICGPNGTGKSGVVDAIEFALTGTISRLSGAGTGELSVKEHAPHVDWKDEPEKAIVTLEVELPRTGKKVTIKRTVAKPNEYNLSPDDEGARKVIEEVQLHPEFVLSRREIIRYIITRPKDRSADVQALLQLEEVGLVRDSLNTVKNTANRNRNEKETLLANAWHEFFECLDIEKPLPEKVLKKINSCREKLSLSPLDRLNADTSLKDGIPIGEKKETFNLKKAETLFDLKILRKLADNDEDENFAPKRNVALGLLRTLNEDASAVRAMRQRLLVKAGLELVEDEACPLCDTEWDEKELREHLAAKLTSAKAADEALDVISENLGHLIGEIEARITLLKRIELICSKLVPKIDALPVKEKIEALESDVATLRSFVDETMDFQKTITSLEHDWWQLTTPIIKCLTACETAAGKLPEETDEDKAREILIRAEDCHQRVIKAQTALLEARARWSIASTAFETYQEVHITILEGLYKEVAGDFSKYYRIINHDDEDDFDAELLPSESKLGFDVNFYGRGKYPPGAYHSEGHQDSMGLCLYLALMKRTLGDDFRFAVFDDVVMSIDAEHRREICKLLKQEFPKTQFILTTHDRVWLKFMLSENLIANGKTFSSWHIDTGPKVWNKTDVWGDIDKALEQDDVFHAAAILRNFLEYVATTLADSLRAKVEFKGNGQYNLGDLLPPVTKRWKETLLVAVSAAQSWENQEAETYLQSLIQRVAAAVQSIGDEQWAINPSIHFNPWADLQAKEFRVVVASFRELLDTLICSKCGAFVEMQPRFGEGKSIQCDCTEISINLKKKSGS